MSQATGINLLGGEFLVNTTIISSQHEQFVTPLANGGFVAVWTNEGDADAPDGTSIFARVFNADSSPLGTEFRVNGDLVPSDNAESYPSVSALTNGGFAVLWESEVRNPDTIFEVSIGVIGRTYTADGTPASDEFQVPFQLHTDTLINAQRSPVSASLTDGGFIVVWLSSHEFPGYAVYSQRYTNTGAPVDGIHLVPTLNGGTTSPAVAGLSDGGYVISWQTYTEDNNQGISAQLFNREGQAVGSEVFVNTTTDGDQDISRIVGLEGGGYVIVWQSSSGPAPYYWEVRGQVFASDGARVGDEFAFYPEGSAGVLAPGVAALQGGGFVVATHANGIPGSANTEIQARLFDANGEAQGEVQQINTETAGPQLNPEIATLSDGQVVVLWDSVQDYPGGTGVYGQIIGIGDGALTLVGTSGADILEGGAFNDTISGLDGADTLIGGDGDDFIFGGATSGDLRDVIYGGDGNDNIDGGYGNDELRGDAGNDTIAGGFGADTVIGGAGDDVLTGSAFGDVIFGGDGDDFVNGGFGHDRVNGGAGADKFYHLGIANHGSDWIQDYNSAEGDVLLWGGVAATAANFQINTAYTANAGADEVYESFVIYRPTGQIIWALVDGGAQAEINIQIGGDVFDLLA